MSHTPQIIGNLLVSIIRLIGQAILVVTLVIAKLLNGILNLLISWIEGILHKSDKH